MNSSTNISSNKVISSINSQLESLKTEDELSRLNNRADECQQVPKNSMTSQDVQKMARGSLQGSVPERIKKDLFSFKSLITESTSQVSQMKKKQLIAEMLYDKLNSVPNAYLYVLDLIYYSSDCMKSQSGTFNKNVLSLFQEWVNAKNIKEQLDIEFKKIAIHMFLQMKRLLGIEIACEVFELKQDKEVFKEIIESYIVKGHYLQAYPVIMALDLQSYFTLQQVALPLVFNYKRVEVEQYLQNYPKLQLQLVKDIDGACCSKYNFSLFIAQLGLEHQTSMDMHSLQKILGKLLNSFKIPIEECPNLMQKREVGALLYVIRKRFMSREMTNESFEEVILTTVRNNLYLQKELLIQLCMINEMKLALKFARILNMNLSDYPHTLLSYEGKHDTWFQAPTDEESWDDWNNEETENYLTLRIGQESVRIVDSLEKLNECVNDILGYDVVGFDAEWRPSFVAQDESKLALLQLAVWDYVYLIDVISLTPLLNPSEWGSFYENIFANSKILKLGFAISLDKNKIREFCAGDKRKLDFANTIDMENFVRNLLTEHSDIKNHLPTIAESSISNFNADKGLSKLCRTVLGIPLNKTDQFSDWQKRPLRQSQIIYAALDAYCLLMIYENLSKCLKQMSLNIYEIINTYLNPPSSIPSILKKKGLTKNQKQALVKTVIENKKYNYMREPIPISEFKVVVDNMLSGLGKELRICGADVILLDNYANHCEAVKIALKQDRYFLTTGKVFVEFCNYLPPGMCYCVELEPLDKQLASIFDYYNVRCTEDDVFTRCTLCNSNRYLKISSKDLEHVWILNNKKASLYPSEVEELTPFINSNEGFVTENGIMHTRTPIAMSGLSEQILSNNLEFCICSGCGKVYWEGSHHRRKKAAVQRWLKQNS